MMVQTNNEWQQFFDGYASKYLEEVFTKDTEREVRFLIEELALPPGSTILDFGCGVGRHTIGLALAGYDVTGLDISQGMLDQAQQTAEEAGVSLKLIRADARYFKSEVQYDVVLGLCEGALGLLSSADDPYERDMAVLRNIHAALKPEGRFIVNVLNAGRTIRMYNDADIEAGRFDFHNLIEINDMPLENNKQVKMRERAYTVPEFVRMLRWSGFVVDHVWGGTAGDWGKRPLKLDEYEMMVLAHREE